MLRNTTSVLCLAVAALVYPGCARMVAGFDGNINHQIASDDWDDLRYKYLSVGSEPEGAVVYARVVCQIDTVMKAGIDYEENDSQTLTGDWVALGSTPVLNHRFPVSGRAIDRNVGSSMRSTFQVQGVSIRVEKPGYETVTIERVSLSTEEVLTPGLVVELVANDGAETP